MAEHNGIGIHIDGGRLVLTRLDGLGLGHVQFRPNRLICGLPQAVREGTVVVGNSLAVFEIPFCSPEDAHEIHANVDMSG